MKVVGISYVGHDHGITIIENNEIKIVYEMERLNRIKRNMTFDNCDLIDVIKNFQGNARVHGFLLLKDLFHNGILALCNAKIMPKPFYDVEGKGFQWKRLDEYKDIEWNGRKFHYSDHHIAHASYAYCTSPFDECDLFVYDGMGNNFNTIFIDKNLDIHDLKQRIGMTWMNTSCHLLGLYGMLQAGTLMAAAAYGKRNNKFIELFFEDFITNCTPELGKILCETKLESQQYFDLCYALQFATERRVIELLKQNKTSDNLCIAGGVGLNGYVNQKILDNKIYKKIYLPPACSDAGLATGIALHANWIKLGNKKPTNIQNIAYLGREFDINEDLIRGIINAFN